VATGTRDSHRVDGEPAFVLHAYPYSETSLLIDAWTSGHGRMPLLARGARRPRAALRGLLEAFQPLTIAWSGRGEVRTLQRAEWVGGLPRPAGRALWCGFYLNELLMRLVARDDPHPALFAHYAQALSGICTGADPEPILRRFEMRLLAELGYGLVLEADPLTRQPLADEARYTYDPDRGPVRVPDEMDIPGALSGALLREIARERFEDKAVLTAAKGLMRQIIAHRLEHRPLRVTQVWRDMLDV
jgi:DNA repair protein RecO (recombination protein O)